MELEWRRNGSGGCTGVVVVLEWGWNQRGGGTGVMEVLAEELEW